MGLNPLAKIRFNKLRKKAADYHALQEAGNPAPRDEVVAAWVHLAQVYDEMSYDKDHPYAKERALEAYRQAALLGCADSLCICGERFLEKGKFWDKLQQEPLGNPVQQKYAANAYQEALHFLQEAQKLKHAGALRLQGLAYVNGWGVEVDTDKGYQMVIESIDWENAWDRATEIFTQVGLNNPEFFAALGNLRKGKGND